MEDRLWAQREIPWCDYWINPLRTWSFIQIASEK
jgi:hypothetical protein